MELEFELLVWFSNGASDITFSAPLIALSTLISSLLKPSSASADSDCEGLVTKSSATESSNSTYSALLIEEKLSELSLTS